MPAKRQATKNALQSKSKSSLDQTFDAMSLVQSALREAYLGNQEDLKDYADKIREFNDQKKAVRGYINQLRGFRKRALLEARKSGIDLCNQDADAQAALAKLFDDLAGQYVPADQDLALISYELCIPERVPCAETSTFEQLDALIKEWESRLNSIGDDAQLANVDMQNWLQKAQQSLQTLSNVSKQNHDTIMSIIRNIKS